MKFSIEKKFEIWNDEDGTRIEVGPDRDGLDLVEIREVNEKGMMTNRITLHPDLAALVAQALSDSIKELA